MNTLELTGWQLDYFTGLAMRYEMLVSNDGAGPAYLAKNMQRPFEPTQNADDLMPALLRMAAVIRFQSDDMWAARTTGHQVFVQHATLNTAVCRALVLAVLGKTVPLPLCVSASSYKNDSVVPDACEDLFA